MSRWSSAAAVPLGSAHPRAWRLLSAPRGRTSIWSTRPRRRSSSGTAQAAESGRRTSSRRRTRRSRPGSSVVLVEQPYRVAGRRSPAPAHQLDTAWTSVLAQLREDVLARAAGDRAAAARRARAWRAGRLPRSVPPRVLCLAFPVHPPGRGDDPTKSRMPELDAVTVPTLVVQGERDPFGIPTEGPNRTVVLVPGTHSLRSTCRDRRGGLRLAGKRRPRARQGALTAHELTKPQARRIAVRAQMLDSSRPRDLIEVVRQLTMLQVDPTAAIAPSADLVAWSRLGSSYRPADLTRALEQDRNAVRAGRDGSAHGRPRPLPRGRGRVPHVRAVAGLVPGQRLVPEGHPEAAPQVRAARVARDPGHLCRAVGLERVDEQPQRHADARVHDDARRDRDLLARRTRAGLGPGRAGLSGGRRAVGGRGRAKEERAAARVARHRAAEGPEDADGAGPRRRGGRACRRRRDEGRMARRSCGARPGLRGPDGVAVSVRPAHPRPPPNGGPVRVRVRPRDVQAGGEAPLGLLRAPDPPRGPPRREARREGRSQGVRASGERDPRGREVHARDE